MAEQFERQNPVYVLGKSGVELAEDYICVRAHEADVPSDRYGTVACTKQSDAFADDKKSDTMERSIPAFPNACCAKDPWASWIGEMIAFYQATSGCSYERIVTALPYKRLVELAIVYAPEATPESFAEILHERVSEAPFNSRLQSRRLAAGFSQTQLAKKAGVSLRTLQQYEQGAKNINHAQAAAVYRLALVLNCAVEDLLESPVR